VRVDLSRLDALVPKQLLHGADIITVFKGDRPAALPAPPNQYVLDPGTAMSTVWVFTAPKGQFRSGVFTQRPTAESGFASMDRAVLLRLTHMTLARSTGQSAPDISLPSEMTRAAPSSFSGLVLQVRSTTIMKTGTGSTSRWSQSRGARSGSCSKSNASGALLVMAQLVSSEKTSLLAVLCPQGIHLDDEHADPRVTRRDRRAT